MEALAVTPRKADRLRVRAAVVAQHVAVVAQHAAVAAQHAAAAAQHVAATSVANRLHAVWSGAWNQSWEQTAAEQTSSAVFALESPAVSSSNTLAEQPEPLQHGFDFSATATSASENPCVWYLSATTIRWCTMNSIG
jgi:hypothetical protein